MSVNPASITKQVMEITDQAENQGELIEVLSLIAMMLGGLVVELNKDERGGVVIHLVEQIGNGLKTVSDKIGEPCCDIIVSKGDLTQ